MDNNLIELELEGLFQTGIKTLIIEYSGYGDSGNVGDIYDKDTKNNVLISDELESFFLEKISGDWYNNEGGQGTITINTKKKTWKIKEGYNETKTTYTYTKGSLDGSSSPS